MELIATQTFGRFTEHIYKNREGKYYLRSMLDDSLKEIDESVIAELVDMEWSVDSTKDFFSEYADGKHLCKKYIPIYDNNTTISLYGFGNTKEEALLNCNEKFDFFLSKANK